MVAILCMLWVANLAFACAEGNKTWWLNLICGMAIVPSMGALM